MFQTVTRASGIVALELEDLAVAGVVEVVGGRGGAPARAARRPAAAAMPRAQQRAAAAAHGLTLQALPAQSLELGELRGQVGLDRGVGGVAGDVVELVRVGLAVVELLLAGLGPDDVGVAVGAHARCTAGPRR